MTVVEDIQHVVGCWHKLASLFIDESQQLKRFDVERKVLQIIWKSDYPDDQVDERMNEQHQIACGSCCQCENPQFHAVVELPAVDLLDVVLGQFIPDVAQMET